MIKTRFQRIYRELRKSWTVEKSAFVAAKLANMNFEQTSELIREVGE